MSTALRGIVCKNRFFSGWNDKLKTLEIHRHTFSLEGTNGLFSFIKNDLILILTVIGSYLSSILLTVKQEKCSMNRIFLWFG